MLGSRVLLAVGLLVFCVALLSPRIDACLCGATGEDFCSCSQRIVRPQPILRIDSRPRKVCKLIGGAQEFQPIGDSCSCNSLVVKPAHQPKPCGGVHLHTPGKTSSCGCGESIRAPDHFQGVNIDGNSIFDEPSRPRHNHIPADPVSLGLAYRAAQQANSAVPEERLQYGFRKLPQHQPHRKIFPNIAEERLQAVDRTIVELKAVRSGRNDDEEELEEEEEEEIDETVDNAPGHLGLADIGYFPTRSHEPQFEKQQCSHSHSVHQPCHDPRPLPAIGDCGFERGQVIVDGSQRQHHHQQQHHQQQQQQQQQFVESNDEQGQVIEINLSNSGQFEGADYDRFRRHSQTDNKSDELNAAVKE